MPAPLLPFLLASNFDCRTRYGFPYVCPILNSQKWFNKYSFLFERGKIGVGIKIYRYRSPLPPKNMGGGAKSYMLRGNNLFRKIFPPDYFGGGGRAKKRREFIAVRGILLFSLRGRTRRKSCFRSSVHTLYASREKGEFELMRTEQRKRRVLNEKEDFWERALKLVAQA